MATNYKNKDWVESKEKRTCEEYVHERIEYKINRYGQKGHRYRNLYWTLAVLAAFGSLLVPALINGNAPDLYPTIVSLIVGFSVASEGIFRPREIWRNYDLLSAVLREEEMLFSRRAGPYHPDQLNEGEDPCAKLVERIENAIANEREATIQLRTSPRQERPMPRVIADSGEENNAQTS